MKDIINLDIKCRICEQMFAKDLKLDMHNKKRHKSISVFNWQD